MAFYRCIGNGGNPIVSTGTVFGVCRDINSLYPAWERTDDSITYAVAPSIGTADGHSDFDNVYPWKGIQRVTMSTGDVMVRIPKFWFQRTSDDSDIEYIRIANKETDGFELHPAFLRAGVTYDEVYVGAYITSSDNQSVSGATPTMNQLRTTMRTNAQSKGDGWGLLDLATLMAIEMLYLVEFADYNSQSAIGYGNSAGTAALNTGSCDFMGYKTGRAGANGTTDVCYRGIEGLWGNGWQYVDGLNSSNTNYYFCNDPTKYKGGTSTDYEFASNIGSHSTEWNGATITKIGIPTNGSAYMLPVTAQGGDEARYVCDSAYSGTGWRTLAIGGNFGDGDRCGLFEWNVRITESTASYNPMSRLQYLQA